MKTICFKVICIVCQRYVPPRLWGFNGHVQTILHSLLGRLRCPWPIGKRTFLYLPDNSTLTYDVYEPLGPTFDEEVTIAVCPGIANTSESVYIRTFVHYAQCHGYRCAVLNHLGALSTVKLTSPRIFSYGHTDDFHIMLVDLTRKYPQSKIIAVGFSLGGNIVTKYLGEDREHPKNLISGVSVCQGYNAIEATKWLLNWNNFRRLYFFVLTEAVKSIILKHRYILLSEETIRKFELNERDIISAATLPELDDVFTRKIYKFNSVKEMYYWSSSLHYLQNIKHPIIFINAKDDPLVPEELLEPVKKFCSTRDKSAFILLSHGGHLGFHEGGLISTNPVSWLDKALIGLVGAMVLSHSDSK
ncbi:Abhydrolase domain-containing protein 2 [Polyplax serrata]|uniref:Abhydrolase domain-containing protein 2 n=1 Tax=Polyplax serrata TaxID=468196 RepID=A0ABR1ALK1_POLSC